MTVDIKPFPNSWYIAVDGGELGGGGVVVEMGPPENPYWFVLCPVGSTLVLDPDDPSEGEDNGEGDYYNPFCSSGDWCDWLQWHREAARFIQQRFKEIP